MMRSGKDGDKQNLHLAPFSFVAEYASKEINKQSHSFGLFFALIKTTAHNETFFALSFIDQRLSLQEAPHLYLHTIWHRGELSYGKLAI
jgi:hypothetical protein